MGTAMAQQHLRNVLAFLNMPTLNQPEMYLQWYDGMIGENGKFSEKPVRLCRNGQMPMSVSGSARLISPPGRLSGMSAAARY